MLLSDKNAVVFAASGAIGGEVARTFAREGARVFLSGRNLQEVEAVAQQIRRANGRAESAAVDALNEKALEEYLARIVQEHGRLDVVFNAIGPRPGEANYGAPAATMAFEKFLLPMQMIAGSQFLTARIAGRHMCAQKSGAIVLLSATLSKVLAAHMAGITAACGAIEAMLLPLADEFGPHGVRVNCVRPNAMPETRTIKETTALLYRSFGVDPEHAPPSNHDTVALRRDITVGETASTVAFLASDRASGISAQVVGVCAGFVVG